jgi:hypothetical protein
MRQGGHQWAEQYTATVLFFREVRSTALPFASMSPSGKRVFQSKSAAEARATQSIRLTEARNDFMG